MGIVRITTTTDVPDNQVTFAYVYDYTYCDQCGSFNVDHVSTTPKKVVKAIWVIIFLYFIVVSGVIIHFTSNWYLGPLIGLLSIIAFSIIAVKRNLIPMKLKCRKCGNEHFTSKNTLNYPEDDKRVIDVPDHLALKQHIQTHQV